MGGWELAKSQPLWPGALTRLPCWHCQGLFRGPAILNRASCMIQQTDLSAYGILNHPVQIRGAWKDQGIKAGAPIRLLVVSSPCPRPIQPSSHWPAAEARLRGPPRALGGEST